jgi:hypothetical protein
MLRILRRLDGLPAVHVFACGFAIAFAVGVII